MRRRLEDAESRALPGNERATRQGLPITHAWAWDLMHDPRIVEPIAGVLGPDVLLWSMTGSSRNRGHPSFRTTRTPPTGGSNPHHVASAWIALSDAGPDTGPMRFLPGSHKGPVFEQEDTYGENNPFEPRPGGQRNRGRVEDGCRTAGRRGDVHSSRAGDPWFPSRTGPRAGASGWYCASAPPT